MNIQTKELLQAIDKMLDKKLEPRFNIIQKQISEIQKEVAKIPEMQKEISEMQSQILKLQKQMLRIEERLSNVEAETKSISKSVAIIEHEHGEKLSVLFDAFTMNNQKIEQQEKRISIYERKIEQHDDDIFYLKNKVQGL